MYRPPKVASERVSGLARITKAKKGDERYFKVLLTQDKGDKATTTEHYIKPANAPVYLKAGEWRIRMSSDKTKIYSAIPSDAIVVAEFYDIAHRENEEPVPNKRTTKYGDTFQFTLIWKVVGGEYDGLEIPHYLTYNFMDVEDERGNTIVTYSHQASKYTEQLDQALTAAGFWNKGKVAYKENILPIVKKRLIYEREENGVHVQITLTDGYVASVKSASGGWDEEGDDEVKVKKPSKEPEPSEEQVEEVSDTDDPEVPWDKEDTEE